eukprot:g2966.t1
MPHSNVFIRGIPNGFDTEDLRYLFEDYGSIVSVKILEPRHLGDKRLGFVKFATHMEAQSAIANMNMTEIAGHRLEVREAELDVDPKKNLIDKVLIENDNLFVRGFPSYWGPKELTEFFSQTGLVVAVRVLGCTMPSRGGVGLVRYSSIAEARDTISKLNNLKVCGFGPIDVKFATVKDPKLREIGRPFRQDVMNTSRALREVNLNKGVDPMNDQATTMNNDLESATNASMKGGSSAPTPIFVDNLPITTTQLTLYENFAQFGAISSVVLGQDEMEVCSGCAFVNFVEAADATRAALTMNGADIHGFIIAVSTCE